VSQTVSVLFVVLVASWPTPWSPVPGCSAARPKTLGIRFAELLIFYLLAGGMALLLERRAGQVSPQTWEF
jgi:hypothetical protein